MSGSFLHMRNSFKNLLIILFPSLISLFLFELSVYIFLPDWSVHNMKEISYINKNGVLLLIKNKDTIVHQRSGDYDVKYSTNKYGFRDSGDLLENTQNTVYFVGDSFTFGQGINYGDRFSDIFERYSSFDSYNIASPGSDLLNYYALISHVRTYGVHVKNIVIGICMENDINNYDIIHPDAHKLKQISNPTLSNKINTFLVKNMSLFYFIRYAKRLMLDQESVNPWRINKYSEINIDSTVTLLTKITKNRRSILLIIPSRELWIGGNKEEAFLIHNKFIEKLRHDNHIVIDMLENFNNETNDPYTMYYFPHDGHWNKKAHELAGKILAQNAHLIFTKNP